MTKEIRKPKAKSATGRATEFGIRHSDLFGHWSLVISHCGFLLAAITASASSPHITSVLPTGGQRGTELEIKFAGERLEDTQEIISYETGIEVLKLVSVTNQAVSAQIKITAQCSLGEHHLRLRAA